MSLRTTKGKTIFHSLAVFVFLFIMRGITLVHAVVQFYLLVYKRKKKSISSSRAPLIDIDPALKVTIKRNDAVTGWSLFIQVRVTHGACEARRMRTRQYQSQLLHLLLLATVTVVIVWIFISLFKK